MDGEFSKNAPYKQKSIFHFASNDKMSKKKFFFCLDGGSVVLFLLDCVMTTSEKQEKLGRNCCKRFPIKIIGVHATSGSSL